MIKKDTLPAVQKMNCLKNFVEGKATTIISSIKLANENYNICLNLFKERRDSHFHMSKLLKLENITDVSGLKNLFDTINVQYSRHCLKYARISGSENPHSGVFYAVRVKTVFVLK